MKVKNNDIYEARKIRDYKELVSIYKNEHKEHIAFKYKDTPQSTEVHKITYSKFARDIENIGTKLLDMGINRACLISPNRYEWYVFYLAVTTAGKTIAPLDKSLPRDEIVSSIKRRSRSNWYLPKREPKSCYNLFWRWFWTNDKRRWSSRQNWL